MRFAVDGNLGGNQSAYGGLRCGIADPCSGSNAIMPRLDSFSTNFMKNEKEICQVCNAKLNLSRRQVNAIAAQVKSVIKDRYFVPDDEVFAIIHQIHDKAQNLEKLP